MALIKDGWWQDTWWASRWWQEDYWLEYGTVVTPPAVLRGVIPRRRRRRKPPLFDRELMLAVYDYLEVKVRKHDVQN